MRTMWELREEPRTRGTVNTIVSFPLNLASGQSFIQVLWLTCRVP